MEPPDLTGKTVLVVGAARSGIAAANLALRHGAEVRITDARPLAELQRALAGLIDRNRVRLESGGHTPGFISAADLVVASPGVWRDAPPLQMARQGGIAVWGEIEFAWRFCRKPVVAVTGSNGKTTTVTLISQVLSAAEPQASGRKVCLCGNIGLPFSDYAADPSYDVYVVEISSFQLELIETFRPHVAVITNFSQNHLDRHPDMLDYFEAKKRIFMNQTAEDFALINARDEWSHRLQGQLPAWQVLFNREEEELNSNQSAALETGRIFGVSETVIRSVLTSFSGVEHRLESVRTINGVEFINDSKSTTVESGRWALTTMNAPVILICGGHDKGMDYRPLRELVSRRVRRLIVLTKEDRSREALHEAFEGAVPIEDHTDMRSAVCSALSGAAAGDKVLLSPMFASFDMFENFEHRGRVFKEIVAGL